MARVKKYIIIEYMIINGKKLLLKTYFFIFSLFVLLMPFFSCKTVQSSQKQDNSVSSEKTNLAVYPVGEGTILSIPAKDKLAEKRLDAKLSSNITKASPESLKNALLFIQNDSKGLTPENQLYLKVISALMYLVYPLKTEETKPSFSHDEEPYLYGLKNVNNGVYPYSMKKDDFLSLIIPPLILVSEKASQSEINSYKTDILERLTTAKNKYPESVLPPYLLGILSELENDNTAAMNFYKTAWNADSSCYPAGLKYGELAAEAGDGTVAVKIANFLSKNLEDNVAVKLLYARGYIASSDLTKASENIITVLKKEPENISALLLRIRILIEQKEYLKANSLLDAYSTKNRTSKDYLLFRARIVKEWNKNTISAIEFLSEAYRLYPEDFNILLACAEICFETSQKIENRQAGFFIEKVLQKDPENTAAMYLLVKNNINLGDWEQAVFLGEKLNGKVSGNVNKELLVTAYLGAGKTEKALALSKQLYTSSKNPSNRFVGLYIEALYRSKNMQAVSQIIKEKLQTADSELKSILHYYNAKLSENKSEAYLSSLRSSLLANPRNKDSLFAMYEWYFNNKDYRKAKYYLGQVIALDPSNKKNTDLAENLNRLLAE
ncbi:lipoprotein [Treponema pedis str. T A4]|uniref:Lipoprotein n=2 Tax=Treponema pedis TaxID=409322 RepID=S5ZVK9_9SPIR|nr:lipoprotein [Treponema pedis str. T A4]